MDNWLKVERSEDGVYDFMELVSGFHDFRIKKFSFDAEKDMCELFLQYDTRKDGIIMRGLTINGFGFHPIAGCENDYECDWIFSSDMRWNNDKKTFIWCSMDDYFDENFRQNTTWFEASDVMFAYCDGEGTIQEIPEVFKRKCVCVESLPKLAYEKDCEYTWRITERGYSVMNEAGNFHDFNKMIFAMHFSEKGEHKDFRGVF